MIMNTAKGLINLEDTVKNPRAPVSNRCVRRESVEVCEEGGGYSRDQNILAEQKKNRDCSMFVVFFCDHLPPIAWSTNEEMPGSTTVHHSNNSKQFTHKNTAGG